MVKFTKRKRQKVSRKTRKPLLGRTVRANTRQPLPCRAKSGVKITRSRSSKHKLHPHVQSFVDYAGHKHFCPSALRNASLHSFPMHRQSVYSRFTVQTGTNNFGFLIINPYYFYQSAVICNSSTSFSPCFLTTSAWTGSLGSYLSDGVTGVQAQTATDGFLSVSTGAGNSFGKSRCVGMTFVIRYLGTELNRGGEVFIAENAEMINLVNSFTVQQIMTWSDTHKYLIGPDAIAHNHTGRCSQELDFQNGQIWANAADSPASTAGLQSVFGISSTLGATVAASTGPDTAPQGWNLGILINSAAASQSFEVEIHAHYEGEFKFSTGAAAYTHETIANANPAQFAAISAVTAAKNQMAVGTSKGSPQFMDTLSNAAAAAFAPVVTTGLEWLADAALSLFL